MYIHFNWKIKNFSSHELQISFYGALGFIFLEPQIGHLVATFFKKVFLH